MFDVNVHANKDSVSMMHLSEKLKAISGVFGVRLGEAPKYYLIRSSGEKEIRKYSALTLASISIPYNERQEQVQADAYQALSGYHFGKNDLAEHIAMTAAILHEETRFEDGEGFLTMSFILPNKYNLKNAPSPVDQRIKLHQKPSHMVACRSFSGPSDEQKVRKYSSELREWLSQYSSYKAEAQVQVAEYNPPQTISFLRKNEVHIDVKSVN